MKIAESSGLVEKMTKGIRPFVSFLFPRIPPNHNAAKFISVNIIANILGLGWASTPAGLKAMEALADLEIERGNPEYLQGKNRSASNEMCIFLILNMSSLQLVPVNIISYRSQYGSVNPSYIVGPAIITTLINSLAAIVYCKYKDRGCKI